MRPAESTLVRLRVVSLPAASAGGIEWAIDEPVPGGKWHWGHPQQVRTGGRRGKIIGGLGEVGEEIWKKKASYDCWQRTSQVELSP